jgi:transposase-like protein
MKPHPSPAQREAAVTLYRHGALIKWIAEAVGCSPQAVNRWARKAKAKRGHAFRPRLSTILHEDSK